MRISFFTRAVARRPVGDAGGYFQSGTVDGDGVDVLLSGVEGLVVRDVPVELFAARLQREHQLTAGTMGFTAVSVLGKRMAADFLPSAEVFRVRVAVASATSRASKRMS
ncbi:hypothetical protein SAMN05444350_13242 [Bacteroides stercorirosoris]|uniref:Uncharacterized protein n=1 Tax=Bacteroides stercorirosoris TaxID=871324 RepID=A0A1M6JVY5_9BACE|nr:hypothetical protein SAMN05444350_13242 [Bacteroides stercorirosoris]